MCSLRKGAIPRHNNLRRLYSPQLRHSQHKHGISSQREVGRMIRSSIPCQPGKLIAEHTKHLPIAYSRRQWCSLPTSRPQSSWVRTDIENALMASLTYQGR